MSLKFKGLLLLGFLVTIFWMVISSTVSSRTHVKQSIALLQALTSTEVDSIVLTPVYEPLSLVKKPITIRDTAVIVRLVNHYKRLSKYRPGQGRLTGQWQVHLTFMLNGRREIHSDVDHNEFANLIFIHSKEKEFGILGDYLADDGQQEISKLLEQYR